MQKNVASQKWVVFAFDETDNTAKTGDAANITGNLRIDGGAANGIDDANPTELEDGYYVFDITQAESNGDYILICPASSTANIQVIGVPGALWTTAAYYNAMGIESDGHVHGDIKQWLGVAPLALSSQRVQTYVGAMADAVITAAKIATSAFTSVKFGDAFLTAAKIAADAITGAKVAAGAIAKGDQLTGLNDLSAAQVNSEADQALTDYDPPTDAEAATYIADVSALALEATLTALKGAGWTDENLTTIDGLVDAIKAITDALPDAGALTTIQADLDNPNQYKANVASLALEATVAALNNLSAAQVNAEADTALTDYDPPTKAEMDTAHALLATPAQVATALTTYDGPTKAEMDAAHALLATAAALITVDTVVDAIKAVTDNLPDSGALTSLATAAAVAALHDFDPTSDNVTVSAITSAGITDIWSTNALSEAYAADGAEGTPAQILYAIQQIMSERSISGVLLTVKKLDGSTQAMQFTLDDATSPTSQTRTA